MKQQTQALDEMLFPAERILRNTESLERKIKGVDFEISIIFMLRQITSTGYMNMENRSADQKQETM